jgi:hypothetical protein
MKEITDFVRGRKKRMLNAVQRRSLHKRVWEHASSLKYKQQNLVRSEKEPAAVAKARKVVAAWEESQDLKEDQFQNRVNGEAKEICQNLLFETVEDSLLQVRDFEETTVDSFLRRRLLGL